MRQRKPRRPSEAEALQSRLTAAIAERPVRKQTYHSAKAMRDLSALIRAMDEPYKSAFKLLLELLGA